MAGSGETVGSGGIEQRLARMSFVVGDKQCQRDRNAHAIWRDLLEFIQAELCAGRDVNFKNIGKLRPVVTRERQVYSVQKGAVVMATPRRRVRFHMSSRLRDRMGKGVKGA